jgi:hypothetical protein
MSLCKGCDPGPCTTTFNVEVNRANLCQWVTGFALAWWRGEKSITLNLHTQRLDKVVVGGKTVYSSDSAGEKP